MYTYMHKQSSALQTSVVEGRGAGIVQVSHRVLERPTHVVFCFWSLLLSSSAVEAQCCLCRRSPCVRRRQRCRGPLLLAPKKPPAAAGALAAIQQRCRGPVLLAPKKPMHPSSAALSRPLAARAEEASGCCWRRRNSIPNAIVKENCRHRPLRACITLPPYNRSR